MKKEILKTDKDGNEIVDTISYKIKFIDSVRFMASSLPNLIDNLTERIHKIKCKGWDCFLEYKRVKGNLIIYKCLSYNKCYSKKLNEGLNKKFKKTFKFSNNNIIIFFCLEKVFIFINIWMIGKSLMKQHYLKKKNFIAT